MIIYVVKSGDTLWQIAQNYRVTAQAIITLNQLPDPNQILIGQALLIPEADNTYVIKSGDTLWKIAQSVGLTTTALMRFIPGVNPNNLTVGQRLYIPPRYTVRSGDTLGVIAARFGTTSGAIAEANGVTNPNVIYPGMLLIIPPKPRPSIEVNGYIYHYGETGAAETREVAPLLTYLCPFAYLIKEDGSLESIYDGPALAAAQAGGVIPMMCITNFTSTTRGENLAHVILADLTMTDRVLANALVVMKQKGYKGLNIDFENVLPEDRENYNRFVQRAVDLLHPEGYFVSTALAPKESATQQGLLYEAHDYAAHGRIADFVILMTYEWGYRKGPPNPISPLNLIKKVLDYAVTVIPRSKIMMGFQIYARDWVIPHVTGQEAATISPQDAVALATKYGSVIKYEPTYQSPYFTYTDENGVMHEVWFEDARSAQAKFDTVKAYNLRGISYWALGYPYPQNWELLRDNFQVK